MGEKIEPEKTLIIFDEIQEIPRALSALKYFCEDAPEYFVAASGSLLGVALRAGTSFPVGKVDMLELAPLSFEEFMTATGNERFLRIVDDKESVKIFDDKFQELFREYLVVGGMPEAVVEWIESENYAEVDKIQNAILLAYLNDISKHTDATTATRIHQIWNSLPAQFAKRNEKFMFNVVMFREFNGFFVEQFVLQQMAGKYDLYYWNSEATAEVDFVTEIKNNVVPIEVKSGENVKAKSLKSFREKYKTELSVRFSLKPEEYNDGLLNLPIYLAGLADKRFEWYLG